MKDFFFKGEIPASKSLMNRALIIQSHFPNLKITGSSDCEDVLHMKKTLAAFSRQEEMFCGDGGTTLRFAALRASRQSGEWILTGSKRLFERPQADLTKLLLMLGVQAKLESSSLKIQSDGWKKSISPLKLDQSVSSQFISGLILNSWNLPFDLEFETSGEKVSEGYLEMTLDFVKSLGMQIQYSGNQYVIPAGQQISKNQITIEMDYSSAFPMACAASLQGEACFTNASAQSFQPDSIFINLLKQMNVPIQSEGTYLTIKKSERLSAIETNLNSAPDLFPVLSVLCAFAKGISKLHGAPQLVHKESDRLTKTAELLSLAGVKFNSLPDGLEIHGDPYLKPRNFKFNPDHDHRMAMAAGLFKIKGFDIQITDHQVVKKSFPQFWAELGVVP